MVKWSCLVVSNSLQPHRLYSARLLHPWDSPGKNSGVGCHLLLQGIFLTQGLNPGLLHCRQTLYHLSYQAGKVVKNLPANAGDTRDECLIPVLRRSPGGGHRNPVRFSCLESPMDREGWWAMVHRVAKSWTQLKQLSTRSCTSWVMALYP